ncbi:MAG: flagellar motor switch protein FliM [Lachnospiraceae bacterium]|jgi:flagellar motor switch protein FliM|nr:flagellar motor switch protein FliM [Lachnospiraceae bacterium]NBJ80779.1 flagellar motor switch protein FliM [bacterium 1XD42-76]NBK03988.1 flagellar motor switch protein FliM [bacterium 1XD42-94]
MADVLSQSQIDELLKSMNSPASKPVESTQMETKPEPEEVKYSKYDFYSPRKFTKDKMKILTSVFENYARIITSQVNGVFRVMTDITVMEVQERRYYEFVNSLKENDMVTLIDAIIQDYNRKLVPLMMYVTPGMVITLIDHMLGGGEDVVKVKDGYRYSDVEIALYRRILSYLIQALRDGFANYINVEFKAQRIEENLSMMQDVGLDETVAIILLNVDIMGLAVERIRICIPGTLLESIFQVIDSRKHIAKGYAFEDNRETILENIRETQLPITGQLGTVVLDLDDVYHLKIGDVIDMNKPKDRDVKLYIGRQPWFTGKMGVYKKNVAIRINERLFDDETSEIMEPEFPVLEGEPSEQ